MRRAAAKAQVAIKGGADCMVPVLLQAGHSTVLFTLAICRAMTMWLLPGATTVPPAVVLSPWRTIRRLAAVIALSPVVVKWTPESGQT
jgi:hypothetical protein